MLKRLLSVSSCCVAITAGCTTTRTIHCPTIDPAPKAPGSINHVVFFDLQDPTDADELIEECYDLFSIPGVTSGYAGKHYDIGRDSVLRDYDVGFFVAFDSEADYRAYVEHPAHVALVEKWQPRWDAIRVYDVGDTRSHDRNTDQSDQ